MRICSIKFKAFDIQLLQEVIRFLIRYCNKYNLQVSYISLPTNRQTFTIIRSPHAQKKSREQFELLIYSYAIYILKSNVNEKIDIKSVLFNLESELKQISGLSFKLITN
jgi:small subunit ribosomal protein S10